MIVVDTNISAYLLIKGEFTQSAQMTFEKDPFWIVPNLWKYEFLNILSTYVKNDGVDLGTAKQIWDTGYKTFSNFFRDVNFTKSLNISVDNNISAYDAQFITLAQDLKLPFITQDKLLLSKFPNIALDMSSFLN